MLNNLNMFLSQSRLSVRRLALMCWLMMALIMQLIVQHHWISKYCFMIARISIVGTIWTTKHLQVSTTIADLFPWQPCPANCITTTAATTATIVYLPISLVFPAGKRFWITFPNHTVHCVIATIPRILWMMMMTKMTTMKMVQAVNMRRSKSMEWLMTKKMDTKVLGQVLKPRTKEESNLIINHAHYTHIQLFAFTHSYCIQHTYCKLHSIAHFSHAMMYASLCSQSIKQHYAFP